MRRAVDQCPVDIILTPSGCPLTDPEYADDVVSFAESTTKLHCCQRSLPRPMDYLYALMNASRCGSLRDLERESGWTDNQ
ncbi:hypothetical protein RB195_001470 [Necator americanus]|uniref:Uncharacterized protein n=1 Tax=Necator americanus TaxID=51031 RepID=A0ABR1DEF7_NECAM